ncbi:MAG: hypothetical protein MJ247_06240 [Alphaproteobacteria bacterium]|nr:hypothetical protein [Alphaproteobacteria bacterium]
MINKIERYILASFLILIYVLVSNTEANAMSFTGTSSKNQEIVLISDGGLEWNSPKQTLTAIENAMVIRGDTTLRADRIVAFYQEKENKKTEILRIRAYGNVIITTSKQMAKADTAVYEIADSVVVLKGSPVTLMTGDDDKILAKTKEEQSKIDNKVKNKQKKIDEDSKSNSVTAEIVEFWQDEQMVIARNNVIATSADKTLEADTVYAYFIKNPKGDLEIDHFIAENNVVVSTLTEKIEGDVGEYNVKTELASIKGNVKISQGENYIIGDEAKINMKTSVSRLLTNAQTFGGKKQQVHGVFVPKQKELPKKNNENSKGNVDGTK